MTRALICGGRDYADREHVFAALDRLHAELGIPDRRRTHARRISRRRQPRRRPGADAGEEAVTDAMTWANRDRECPGSDCMMCNGEACKLCGAGCWIGSNKPQSPCEHDVIERHTDPVFGVPDFQLPETD